MQKFKFSYFLILFVIFICSSLTAISFWSCIHTVHLLLLITNVWIIMCVHCPVLFLILSHHISTTATCWLFLCYFWRMRSHTCSITSMMAWIWNLNVITVMTLMLLECLRMSALSKSIILRTVVHNHFRLKRLINDVWIISLAR